MVVSTSTVLRVGQPTKYDCNQSGSYFPATLMLDSHYFNKDLYLYQSKSLQLSFFEAKFEEAGAQDLGNLISWPLITENAVLFIYIQCSKSNAGEFVVDMKESTPFKDYSILDHEDQPSKMDFKTKEENLQKEYEAFLFKMKILGFFILAMLLSLAIYILMTCSPITNREQLHQADYKDRDSKICTIEISSTHVKSNSISINYEEPVTIEEECLVCMDSKIEVVFKPCGHACCCKTCTESLISVKAECPLCRSFIEENVNFTLSV